MVDWMDNLVDLLHAYSSCDEQSPEHLYDTLVRFLIHVPAHVVAASELVLDESFRRTFDVDVDN